MKPILEEYTHPDQERLKNIIYENAHLDQKRTSVRVYTADCKIYQPMHEGLDTFEPIRKDFNKHFQNYFQDKNLWVCKDIWGLYYEYNHSADAHYHPNMDFTAIWFLEATDGCGTLHYFLDSGREIVIEPKTNMLVIAGALDLHGVLPSIDPDSKRCCIVLNVLDRRKLPGLNSDKGFYVVDEDD